MIQFIYGSSGSGKTTALDHIIQQKAEKGEQVILLVPEQEVLSCERRLSELCGDRLSFHIQVLSFRRFANTVFRTLGGLKYDYVTKGEKAVILWRALASVAPFLKKYQGITLRDRSFLSETVACIDEFKAYRITPADLEQAAGKLTEAQAGLSQKLFDLSLIFAAYQSAMQHEFDDPSDDLSLLLEKLPEAGFLAETHVMVDSFYGFTGVEGEIIAALFELAKSCTITLPYDQTENIMYESLRRTDRALRQAALHAGQEIAPDLRLTLHPRFKNDELAFLERNLWQFSAEPYTAPPQHVQVARAHDIYDEAEFIAREIRRKIRTGKRYKDIAVIARNADQYTGVIDAVFEKHGVPCFMSKRTDITLMPSVKLILCALNIRIYGWKLDDVITYIKTGVCGLSPDECDLLENYAAAWGITGRRWTDEYEWNMNPAGYTDRQDETDAAILTAVNELRERVRQPLLTFFECFDQKATVRSISIQLVNYLNQIDFTAGIRDQCRATQEGTQVWNALMNCLERLVLCAGDTPASAETYRDLLSIVLAEANIGKIPSCVDEVIVGDASLLRLHEVSDIYVIGANEGVFPKAAAEGAMLSDGERKTLQALGLSLGDTSEMKNAEELFFFYKSVSTPSQNITVTYPGATLSGKALSPSIGVNRIMRLFPALTLTCCDQLPALDYIEDYDSAFEYAAYYNDTPLGSALLEFYSADPAYAGRLEALDMPDCQYRRGAFPLFAGEFYHADLNVSQSRLDSFAKCEFSFHCKYTLGLKSAKTPEFKSVDIGNFMHMLLERFMSRICQGGHMDPYLSRAQCEKLTDEIIEDYILQVLRGKNNVNARLRTLMARLRRTALLLIENILEEFQHSDFRPAFFELSISDSAKEGGPCVSPYAVTLPDGKKIRLYGKIDRVDAYQKDGKIYISNCAIIRQAAKTFPMDLIEKGQEMQMLLYLFAIWKNKDPAFSGTAGSGRP